MTFALPPAQALAADGWGSSHSFGPSTSSIVYAKTTLVPGRFPPISSSVGPLFLWPGMSNGQGDLIQTTLEGWPDNAWCVRASVFGSFGQRDGDAAAIDPDDHVTIEYKLEADGNTWTQTVTSQKLGRVVSTLQSDSGPLPGTGFGFATEADADSFTIDNQYYLCTELHFAEADPQFASTGVGAVGAQYGATGTGSGIGTAENVRTPDGGLTWLIDLITLPPMQPQGTQTPPPAINCDSAGTGSTGGTGGTGGTNASADTGTTTTGSGGTSSVTDGGTAASGSGGASSDGGTAASGSGGASSASDGGTAASSTTGSTTPGAGGTSSLSSSNTSGTTGDAAVTSGATSSTSGGLVAQGGSGAIGSGGTEPVLGGSTATEGGPASSGSASSSDPAGCACRTGRGSSPGNGFGLALVGLMALFGRRRRTSRGVG